MLNINHGETTQRENPGNEIISASFVGPKILRFGQCTDVGRDFNELCRFVAFPLQKIKKKKLVKV